jgi:hypothetical protein
MQENPSQYVMFEQHGVIDVLGVLLKIPQLSGTP